MNRNSSRRTWDQTLASRLRGTDGRRRRRGLLTALLSVGLVVGLLPNLAQAHEYGPPGIGGAQITVDPDGYPGQTGRLFSPSETAVEGTGFVSNGLAEIFQCPEGAINLHTECLPIGTAPTLADGSFARTTVVVVSTADFMNGGGGPTACRGPATAVQCSVVAATYDPTTAQPTSVAEHYICFGPNGDCKAKPVVPTTSTTIVSRGEDIRLTKDEEFAPNVGGAAGNVTDVTGTGFVPDAVARIFQCPALADDLLNECKPIGTAQTDAGGGFGPVTVPLLVKPVNGSTLFTECAKDGPVTNSWSAAARLALPRAELAAATGPDGLIYAIGGKIGSDATVDTAIVEAYDPVANEWRSVAPMLAARANHGAATGPDGRIYVIGTQLPRVESYAPGPGGAPGAWIPRALTHPTVSNEMAVATGPDGLIYATGGTDGTRSLRIARTYDTASDTLTTSTEAMTSRRAGHAAAAGRDGRIYVIGGYDEEREVLGPDEVPHSSVESLKVAPNNCPGAPVADFDGDEVTDISVFRPSTGTWFVKDGLTLNYGTEGDIPVPADYDGDRKADVAVFRPSNGMWFVRQSSGGDTALAYGTSGDIPVPGDYDGDEKTDMAVFRPSNGVWFIKYSGGGDAALPWGTQGDVAVPTDYDGDKKADTAVFRNGTWFIRPASGAPDITVNYGTSGDIPVPGDYDADNTADIAVFRPSNGFWFLRHSSDGTQEAFHFGTSGDVPVPGDYNADAIADPAVFRPSSGVWFVETGFSAAWGTATDIPLPLPHAVRGAYFAS